GPGEHPPKSLCEFLIRGGIGSYCIDRSTQCAVGYCLIDYPYHIVDVDPAHILLTVSDRAAHSHLERKAHLRKRAATATEYYSNSQIDRAYSFLFCSFGRRLPFAAYIGK